MNWFTDGGICSNFPIHFFDRWLPTRPTFGINLTSMPPEALEGHKVKERHFSHGQEGTDAGDMSHMTDAVYLPKAGDLPSPQWSDVPNMFEFCHLIFDTAREHLDYSQSLLPSYRERIVQIRFNKNQGGMNLAMDPNTIKSIVSNGREAGQKVLST